jgi:hypothetical protein
MLTTFPTKSRGVTVTSVERRETITWWLLFLGLLGVTGMFGVSMLRSGPHPAMLVWFCYLTGIGLIFYQPRYGVYLTLGLSLFGDMSLATWYPFVKNFSSAESLLYVNDALIFSPAETFIVLTFVSWLGRGLIQRKIDWHGGDLFWPAMVFIAFITFGLGYGIMRGGSLNTGLWEARPIFYLPAMLVLTSNLIQTRRQAGKLLWIAMIAIFLEGISGTLYVANTLQFELSSVERISEHSASIHANTFFVLLIGAWMFRASYARRLIMPVMLPFVALSYLANQRRAAFITLTIAIVLILAILYWENRKAFWLITPVLAVVGMAYLAVFWNSSGTLGMFASAIKSVVAEDASSAADQASNLYRMIENANTNFTIQNAPLTGVGFGNKFYIIIPMPDISFFVWWEYIVHNSVMWIWMKAGIGGFLSMIFLVGLSIMVGGRAFWRMPPGDIRAIALTATLYILMHFVYAYVDMSWDNQSMIYVGTMMGLVNRLEKIVATPEPVLPKRWPWQPDPRPAPGLKPL